MTRNDTMADQIAARPAKQGQGIDMDQAGAESRTLPGLPGKAAMSQGRKSMAWPWPGLWTRSEPSYQWY
jgi:hypothetical protein